MQFIGVLTLVLLFTVVGGLLAGLFVQWVMPARGDGGRSTRPEASRLSQAS